MIDTERLILRPWREQDRAPFAEICADPRVMDWLGGAYGRTSSDSFIDRAMIAIDRLGYGRWALERRSDAALIGSVGMMPTKGAAPPDRQEIGWRLAFDAWGMGYASEAAKAALADGFSRCGLQEILAYTAAGNTRSLAVMARIGFARDSARDFTNLDVADPALRRQLVHAIKPAQ